MNRSKIKYLSIEKTSKNSRNSAYLYGIGPTIGYSSVPIPSCEGGNCKSLEKEQEMTGDLLDHGST